MTVQHTPERDRSSPISDASSGFRLLFAGVGLLRRERSLWKVALVPSALAAVALLAATAGLVAEADALSAWIGGLVPSVEAGQWYTWLWIGPAKLALWLVETLLFLLLCAMVLVVALLVASVAAAPFLDLLSQRVELIEAGQLVEVSDGSARAIAMDVGRSLVNELRRVAFLAGVWIVLFGLGWIIPGGQLITSPLMIAFTIVFLPLEYAGHVLDRRQISFARRRVWLRARLPRMIGFGSAAFATLLVPGLNFVAMPALVTAGTLLAVRYPPEA